MFKTKSIVAIPFAILYSLLNPMTSYALTFELPKNGDNVVGEVQTATVEPGDDFHTIARRYDLGYYELIEANPSVDADNPKPWSTITIPSKFILPDSAHRGIVINLSELRLYYYPPKQNVVMTFPIGIGREGWNTPLGEAKVVMKTKDPTWTVPTSILKDAEERGITLPTVVGPGPENPLGNYKMRLSIPSILIHGTNLPDGVGMRSSAGCIRLYPEDIEKLFEQTQKGTPVRIMNDPYKVGMLDNKVYLEAHLPLQEQQAEYSEHGSPVPTLVQAFTKNKNVTLNWNKINQVTKIQSGIPSIINQPAVLSQDTKANNEPVSANKVVSINEKDAAVELVKSE